MPFDFVTHRPAPQPLPPDATREGLTEAVLRDPSNDGPRWVMADWFEGREDPRGAFIAVQLTLAGMSDDDEAREEWTARETALLSRHKKSWTERFKGTLTDYGVVDGPRWTRRNPTVWTFERGFVHSVKMALADFAVHSGVLLSEEPVQKVALTQTSGQVRPFLENSKWLERLPHLSLRRCVFAEGELSSWLQSKRFTGTHTLDLTHVKLGARKGPGLLACLEHWPALRELRLHNTGIHTGSLKVLKDNGILDQLEVLGVGGNRLDDTALDYLLSCSTLKTVVAFGNRFSPSARAQLQERFVG